MLINSYVEEISKRIKGKRVLDVGCCASTSKNLLKRHFVYKKAAGEIVGVDYNKVLIQEAKERFNYNIEYCDLTNRTDVENIVNKFGKFDIVICTDVIEHIGNLTNFLENLKLFLNKSGVIHITTPNMRSSRWLNMFINGKIKINKDHVCWFDVFTLSNLLKRSGLKINEEIYYAHDVDSLKKLKLNKKDWMAAKLYVIVGKG
jgi:2-polyprenyl-3-methyl-5-hydroxy-6-metoxy-1,4-benzoquinol methylase